MNTWGAHLKVAQRYLGQRLKAQIYGYPHFLLECFLVLFIVSIYIYLNYEVRRISDRMRRMTPKSVQYRKAVTGRELTFFSDTASFSGASLTTSITHVQEFCEFAKGRRRRNTTLSTTMSWLPHQDANVDEMLAGDYNLPSRRRRYHRSSRYASAANSNGRHILVERLTALTPAQFVRLDKEEQLRNIQTANCMHSLTTLLNNILNKRVPEAQLREQLDRAKEDCECSHVSDQLMKYLDSERVTDSLIDLLNEIIEEASDDNTLPMAGDLATLIYDIGNLKGRSSMFLENTRCDMVPSSASSTDIHHGASSHPATATSTTANPNALKGSHQK